MIIVEKATWERKEHVSMTLSIIYIYWIIAKNDKNSQNQEIINRRSKILKYCCKANILYADRKHQISMKFLLSTYN